MVFNNVHQAQSLWTIDDAALLLPVLINIIQAVQLLYDHGYIHLGLSTSNVGYISDGIDIRGVIFDLDMDNEPSYLKERPPSTRSKPLSTQEKKQEQRKKRKLERHHIQTVSGSSVAVAVAVVG